MYFSFHRPGQLAMAQIDGSSSSSFSNSLCDTFLWHFPTLYVSLSLFFFQCYHPSSAH